MNGERISEIRIENMKSKDVTVTITIVKTSRSAIFGTVPLFESLNIPSISHAFIFLAWLHSSNTENFYLKKLLPLASLSISGENFSLLL